MIPLLILSSIAQVLEWDLLTSMTHVRAVQPVDEGLWCATSGGVFFYDYDGGYALEYRYPADLPHFEVNDILLDGAGRLWCATAGGLAKLEGGSWEVFTSFEGIPGQGGMRDVELAGSWIWVGSDGGLARWTGEDFLPMDESVTQGGFTAGDVTGLEEMGDTLWIATGQGVFSLDLLQSPFAASAWHDWSEQTGDLGIEGFLAASDSLFGFGGKGVFRKDPGEWTILLDCSMSEDSVVVDLASTPDGLLAAGYGIRRRVSGKDWELWGTGFPAGTYATFVTTGGGRIWCGVGSLHWTNMDYGAGLAFLDSGAWVAVPVPGLPGRSCYQPLAMSGRIYAGSHNRGLMAAYPGGWRIFDTSDGMPNTLRTYPAIPAGGDAVWTASYHYGLTWIRDSGTPGDEDDSLVTFVSDSILPPPPLTTQVVAPLLNNQTVCLARQGDAVWIGQESFWSTPDEPSGVCVCVGDPAEGGLEWASFTESEGLAFKNVRALAPHGSEGLWIAFAGDAGCQYLDHAGTPLNSSDDTWLPGPGEAYSASSGLPSSQVFCFREEPDGSVLVGTGSGLSRWDPSSGFVTIPGVSGTVKAIAADSRGTAWCLGSSAVWAVEGTEVTSFTSDNSPYIPHSRVENEFASWDASAGCVMMSSSIGIWLLFPEGGTAAGGSPSFSPQPFVHGEDDLLELSGVSGGPVEVDVFTLDGMILASIPAETAEDWQWDVTSGGEPLSSGLYLVLIDVDGETSVSKLAVVR